MKKIHFILFGLVLGASVLLRITLFPAAGNFQRQPSSEAPALQPSPIATKPSLPAAPVASVPELDDPEPANTLVRAEATSEVIVEPSPALDSSTAEPAPAESPLPVPEPNLTDLPESIEEPESREVTGFRENTIRIAPFISYHLVNSTRNDNGQQAQLASKVGPGATLSAEQGWSPDFSTFASLRVERYSFVGPTSVSVLDASGSSWGGKAGARWQLSNFVRWEMSGGGAENFSVATETGSTNLRLVKYVRAEMAAAAHLHLWRGKRGEVSLVPNAARAFFGKNGESSASAHFAYGLQLNLNRFSERSQADSGLSIQFQEEAFTTVQSKNKNTSLRLNLQFGFGF